MAAPVMTSNRPYLLRAVHEWICDNGLTPYIVVDAASPGVQVPPQAARDGRVVLNLAPRAVSRLDIGNDAITFMARFGGVSHAISVPVQAVQAIYAHENGHGMLLADAAQGADAPTGTSAATSAAPTLQAVPPADAAHDGDAVTPDAATPPDAGTGPGKPRPKGKPSLHVVK